MRTPHALRRLSGGRSAVAGIALGLGGFVVGVYLVVVLGGGVLIGRTDSPSPLLSVLATVVVALLFAPVQRLLERRAARRGHGLVTPYDVLSRFSETMAGGGSDAITDRMARLLAEGTGAAWAQVWLSDSERLTLAASWPPAVEQAHAPPEPGPDARDASGDGRRALLVRQGDQVLGALRLEERPGLPLSAVEERLFRGLAAQAGLVLSLVRLRADLESRRVELVERADDLQASRHRLISAHDSERRRLERDIHDGAQQHVVALAVNLRLAETVATRSPERALQALAVQADAARAAIETLSSLSRGIYPRLLADEGLLPALRAATAGGAIPVSVEAVVSSRHVASVEAALYFCCMEAVQNAAKHSGATSVTVRLSEHSHTWRLIVSDDGVGIAAAALLEGGGIGLANMRDRLDAVGGSVVVGPGSGGGTSMTATVASPGHLEPALA